MFAKKAPALSGEGNIGTFCWASRASGACLAASCSCLTRGVIQRHRLITSAGSASWLGMPETARVGQMEMGVQCLVGRLHVGHFGLFSLFLNQSTPDPGFDRLLQDGTALAFSPPLPSAKLSAIRRLGFGTTDKIFFRYLSNPLLSCFTT